MVMICDRLFTLVSCLPA